MKHILLSTGIKQKPIAREIMILLVAITLGTVLGTNAMAAGPIGGGGGGGHGGGGGFGGGRMGGGFGGEHAGGSPMGGLGAAHMGGLGGIESRGTRFGGGSYDGHARFGGDHDGHHHFDRDHDGHHRFGRAFFGTYGYFPSYDDYGYDNFGDYANDGACLQYRHVHTAAGWRWRQVWVCN